METTRLGRTDLRVTRTSFGALPIQRVDMEEARRILRKAYDAGINFYDTARGYTDSEEKLGATFADVRDRIIIATKSGAKDKAGILRDLETSLRNLKTDYVDILQPHNAYPVPKPGAEGDVYEAMLEAKEKGMIRFIGISSHRLDAAREAVTCGLYDTLQYPLCYLSNEDDLALVDLCRQHDVGLIAMKALSGGLITNAAAAFAFLRQYDNVAPIWGIQRESELDEFLALDANPPALDDDMRRTIAHDRVELGEAFCRACGYCLPCPADIPIPMAARMSLLLRRMPHQPFLSDEWREKMENIENCTGCDQCVSRCPYNLNPRQLLRKMLDDYRIFYEEHKAEPVG